MQFTEAEFNHVVRKQQSQLRAWAAKVARRYRIASHADDIMQDALIQVLKDLPNFQAKFKANSLDDAILNMYYWDIVDAAVKVAGRGNAPLNHTRRSVSFTDYFVMDEEQWFGEPSAKQEEPTLDRNDFFHFATLELPLKASQAITLYYRDGLNMREVAEQLGVTESRVSQLITQALKQLGDSPTLKKFQEFHRL